MVGPLTPAQMAREYAGCDVVLVCNDFAAMDDLLARWTPPSQPALAQRWERMAGR